MHFNRKHYQHISRKTIKKNPNKQTIKKLNYTLFWVSVALNIVSKWPRNGSNWEGIWALPFSVSAWPQNESGFCTRNTGQEFLECMQLPITIYEHHNEYYYYWLIINNRTLQPEAELRLKLQSIRNIYTILEITEKY